MHLGHVRMIGVRSDADAQAEHHELAAADRQLLRPHLAGFEGVPFHARRDLFAGLERLRQFTLAGTLCTRIAFGTTAEAGAPTASST